MLVDVLVDIGMLINTTMLKTIWETSLFVNLHTPTPKHRIGGVFLIAVPLRSGYWSLSLQIMFPDNLTIRDSGNLPWVGLNADMYKNEPGFTGD